MKAKNKKAEGMVAAAHASPRGPQTEHRAAKDALVDLGRLLDLVGVFSQQTICVVGDFVLDEFVSGEISRVSREAPVLILRHRRSGILSRRRRQRRK